MSETNEYKHAYHTIVSAKGKSGLYGAGEGVPHTNPKNYQNYANYG